MGREIGGNEYRYIHRGILWQQEKDLGVVMVVVVRGWQDGRSKQCREKTNDLGEQEEGRIAGRLLNRPRRICSIAHMNGLDLYGEEGQAGCAGADDGKWVGELEKSEEILF